MKKRILTLLMAASLCVGALTGCGDSGAPAASGDAPATGDAAAAGVKDKIYVCGRDAVADELASIKNDEQNATIYQDPVGIGSQAVEVMHKLVAGETVEKMIYSTNTVANKDNVDKFIK